MIQNDFQKWQILDQICIFSWLCTAAEQQQLLQFWIKRSAEFSAAASPRPGLSLTQFVNGKERVGRVVDILLFPNLLLHLLLLHLLLLLLLLSSIRRPLGPWRRVRPQWTGQTGSEASNRLRKSGDQQYNLWRKYEIPPILRWDEMRMINRQNWLLLVFDIHHL